MPRQAKGKTLDRYGALYDEKRRVVWSWWRINFMESDKTYSMRMLVAKINKNSIYGTLGNTKEVK